MKQVNLLHPLASLKWSEYSEIPVDVYNAQAVVLGNKIYIGRIVHDGSSSKLLVFDFTEDSYGILDTPTEDYTLTTYHSQVVLVGGRDPGTGKAINQLWVLDEQDDWSESLLPPMIIKRYQAPAISVGDHLVVAGGCCSDGSPLATVEVYDGHQWRQAQSLPRACPSMKSAVLEGNWYLASRTRQGCKIYHTCLESLIATLEEAGQTSVWKKLPGAPLEWTTLAVFRNQLITVEPGYYCSSAICAYFPNTNSWVHVGDLPVACYSTCTLVLPTEELLVIGPRSGLASCLFRASIGETSFPDSHFDMSSLDRLEKVAGIDIFSEIDEELLEMALALDLDKSTRDTLSKKNGMEEGSKAMMEAWLSGESPLSPTWQVLLQTLQAIQKGELAQEIEHFFNTIPATSPSASLISDTKKEDIGLNMSEIESKEQQTKPDCRAVAVQNSPDYQEVAVQTHSEATAAETIGSIYGTVIGKAEFIVPTKGLSFEWRGYGLRLHIPKDSLPPGMEECRINIRASLSGQFQLPEDSALFSPVFWISVPCKFSKPVTLEIQHCAFREDETVLSDLSFVSAKCSQRDLPYRFRQVDGGVFTTHSSYGSIQLSHFSGFAVTGRKSTPRSYCAHLYHTMKQVYDWRFYFIITQDLDAKNTVVREHYGHFAKKEVTLRLRFERSEIMLKIPEDGLVTREGWRIVPCSHPTISRKDVDQFEPGQWIPECQFVVEWEREGQRPVRLRHKVDLIGAKKPYNFILLTLNPAMEDVESLHSPGLSPSRGECEGSLPTDSVKSPTPDMKDLMDALYHTVADKWEHIGIYLHLPMATLKTITVEHQHDPHKCLIGMLDAWLKRVDPPPTWYAIVAAVKFLGEEQLARELREKYCP